MCIRDSYYGVKTGENISLFTNNDSAYETAISLNKSGVKVNLIVDIRKNSESLIVKEALDLGLKVLWESTVVETQGYKKIKSFEVMKLSDDGSNVIGNKTKHNCVCFWFSGGWTPMVQLFTQSGGKLKFRNEDNVFIPDQNKTPTNQISVGSCNGEFKLDEIVTRTIENIKCFLDLSKTCYDEMKINCPDEKSKRNIWLLPSDKPIGKTKPFLDFQNDSTARMLNLHCVKDLNLLNM